MTSINSLAGGQSRYISRVVIAIALVGLALLAWNLRAMLLLIFGAVVVAVVLRALAAPLHHRLRLPEGVALLVTLLLIVGAAALLSWGFGAQVSAEARALAESLPGAWRTLVARLGDTAFGVSLTRMIADAAPSAGGLLAGAGQFAASLTSGLANAVLVLVGGLYLAAQPRLYRGGLLKLIPTGRRPLVDEAIGDSGRALQLWLKAQLLSMIAVGVLIGGGLWLLGVPLPFLLGLLAGLFNFIPLAGPVIAGVPAVLLALTVSPTTALWAAGLCVLVQQLEGNILLPLFQQKAVDLPPVLLLFALLGFGSLFGAIGVVLAAPLTVVAFVMVKRLYVREALDTPTSVPGEDQSPS